MKNLLAFPIQRILILAALLCGGVAATRAQETNLLLHYTNVWRYLDTGADPGADWAQPSFDDSAWPAGPGPFGYEDIPPYTYPVAVQTPLALGSPSTPAHFLRTHFTMTNFPPGTELLAQCYLDDSMVLFLNGVEVQRLLMPSNQTYQTYSDQWSTFEGTNHVFRLTTNLAVFGENVLAVEIHQSSPGSSDVFWGMKLSSVTPAPLVITRQPVSIATNSGASATFDVGVAGAPAMLQWFGNGVAISGATNQSYSITNVQANLAGGYQVVASNSLGAVASVVATLAVVNDTFPPVLLSARATNVPPSTATNGILLTFSEPLSLSASNVANYAITNLDTGAAVDVVKAQLNKTMNLVRLSVGTVNWMIGGRYEITVNRNQDTAGNVIATNSRISLVWPNPIPLRIPLIATNSLWHYHSAYLADPAIVDSNWTSPDYRENEFWLPASGPFAQYFSYTFCFGPIQTVLHNQAHPSLFRIPFLWPTGLESGATLQIKYLAKDGLGLFLNGTEIFRNNLVQSTNGPISPDTHAASDTIFCTTVAVAVTNLVPGTNWLAAAVFQRYFYPRDLMVNNPIVFALAMDGDYQSTGAEIPKPHLTAHRQSPDSVVFTWTGTNCILQRKTSLSTNAIWSDVTPPTNGPVTLPADAVTGFFRLRQP